MEDIDDVAIRELKGNRLVGERSQTWNGGGRRTCLRRRLCVRSGCWTARGGRRNLGRGREWTRTNRRGVSRFGLPESGSQRCETQRHGTEWAKHALCVIGQGAKVKIIAPGKGESSKSRIPNSKEVSNPKRSPANALPLGDK